jgi:hypothetical protein
MSAAGRELTEALIGLTDMTGLDGESGAWRALEVFDAVTQLEADGWTFTPPSDGTAPVPVRAGSAMDLTAAASVTSPSPAAASRAPSASTLRIGSTLGGESLCLHCEPADLQDRREIMWSARWPDAIVVCVACGRDIARMTPAESSAAP